MRIDRQTDGLREGHDKAKVALRNYANAPKNNNSVFGVESAVLFNSDQCSRL
jgi:hypothetical protein